MLVCGFELDDVILAGSFVTCAISWSALKSLKDSVCFISITAPGSGLFVVNTCWKRTCNEKTRWLGTTLFSPFGIFSLRWSNSPFLSIFQPFFKRSIVSAFGMYVIRNIFDTFGFLSNLADRIVFSESFGNSSLQKNGSNLFLVTSWHAPIFALCLISVWRTSLSMIPHSAL